MSNTTSFTFRVEDQKSGMLTGKRVNTFFDLKKI